MAPSTQVRKSITIGIPVAASDPTGAGEFKESAYKDASSWNSLLRWHRKNRGPQWDYSTAMYHVDIGSAEYYGGVEPAEPETKEEEKEAEAEAPKEIKSPERATASRTGRPLPSASATPQNAAIPLPIASASTSESQRPPSQSGASSQALQPTQLRGNPTSLAASQPAQPQVGQSNASAQQSSSNPLASGAAAMSPEMRQQYEAMFHANRQRAAAAQQQAQQQQGSPQALQQRLPPNAAHSPPAGMQNLPQGQGFFQQSQQPQHISPQQMFRGAQPQQVDPRALFQQPQQ